MVSFYTTPQKLIPGFHAKIIDPRLSIKNQTLTFLTKKPKKPLPNKQNNPNKTPQKPHNQQTSKTHTNKPNQNDKKSSQEATDSWLPSTGYPVQMNIV